MHTDTGPSGSSGSVLFGWGAIHLPSVMHCCQQGEPVSTAHCPAPQDMLLAHICKNGIHALAPSIHHPIEAVQLVVSQLTATLQARALSHFCPSLDFYMSLKVADKKALHSTLSCRKFADMQGCLHDSPAGSGNCHSSLGVRAHCHCAGTRSRFSEGPCTQQQGKPQVPSRGSFPTSVTCHAPLQNQQNLPGGASTSKRVCKVAAHAPA